MAHGTRAARDAGQRRGGRDRDRGRHARARVKPDRLVVQGAPVPGDISYIAARGCRVCEFVVVEARRCSRKRSNARARSGDGRPRGAPRGGARGPEPARGRFGAPRAGGRALASGVCERARAGVLRSDVLGRMRVGRGGSVSRRAGRRRRGRGVDARVRGGHDARRRRADRDDAPVLRAARRHGTTPGRPPESRPGRVRASGHPRGAPARAAPDARVRRRAHRRRGRHPPRSSRCLRHPRNRPRGRHRRGRPRRPPHPDRRLQPRRQTTHRLRRRSRRVRKTPDARRHPGSNRRPWYRTSRARTRAVRRRRRRGNAARVRAREPRRRIRRGARADAPRRDIRRRRAREASRAKTRDTKTDKGTLRLDVPRRVRGGRARARRRIRARRGEPGGRAIGGRAIVARPDARRVGRRRGPESKPGRGLLFLGAGRGGIAREVRRARPRREFRRERYRYLGASRARRWRLFVSVRVAVPGGCSLGPARTPSRARPRASTRDDARRDARRSVANLPRARTRRCCRGDAPG